MDDTLSVHLDQGMLKTKKKFQFLFYFIFWIQREQVFERIFRNIRTNTVFF
jgi:hypothetical protein